MNLRFAVCLATLACGSATFAQQSSATDAAAKAAIDLARAELVRQLNLSPSAVEVMSATPQTWPNSGLGCAKPGEQTAQVMRSGYAVLFRTPQGNKRVHATDKYAVICDVATMLRNPAALGLPLKDLNDKMEKARADLSTRIGAPLDQIRIANVTTMEWPDSSMECPVPGETVAAQRTKGHRLALRYKDRIYTYHAAGERVRACPAIEND